MPELHVLRVFCAEGGTGGNPLGVYLDGAAFDPSERQAEAKRLGFSETVFVDDPSTGELRIFTPALELPSRAIRSWARRGCSPSTATSPPP